MGCPLCIFLVAAPGKGLVTPSAPVTGENLTGGYRVHGGGGGGVSVLTCLDLLGFSHV